MTALERAKAFVNSRAARTALKIMPLALATVATVTVAAPKAHADVALTPTSASFVACDPGTDLKACSGSFAQTSSTTSITQLPLDAGVKGAEGSGNASGVFKSTSPGHDYSWDFFLNGTGSGDSFFQAGIDTLTVSWNFSFPNSDSVTHVDDAISGFAGPKVLFVWSDATHTDVTKECDNVGFTGTCVVSGLNNVNIGTFTSWQAQVEVPVYSDTGVGNMNWQLDYLDVNANGHQTTPPGVPEPASILLALSGLPLIGTLIRKKR